MTQLATFVTFLVTGCFLIFFAVLSHALVQGYFDPTILIDFLTLKKIGHSGPRTILAFGYLLLLWGLPGLLLRRTRFLIVYHQCDALIVTIKMIRYGFPILWVILFIYLGLIFHETGGEEGLFFYIVVMALVFPSSLILVFIIRSLDYLTHFADIVSRDGQHVLFTLLFAVVGLIQWYSVIWLLTSQILKRKVGKIKPNT